MSHKLEAAKKSMAENRSLLEDKMQNQKQSGSIIVEDVVSEESFAPTHVSDLSRHVNDKKVAFSVNKHISSDTKSIKSTASSIIKEKQATNSMNKAYNINAKKTAIQQAKAPRTSMAPPNGKKALVNSNTIFKNQQKIINNNKIQAISSKPLVSVCSASLLKLSKSNPNLSQIINDKTKQQQLPMSIPKQGVSQVPPSKSEVVIVAVTQAPQLILHEENEKAANLSFSPTKFDSSRIDKNKKLLTKLPPNPSTQLNQIEEIVQDHELDESFQSNLTQVAHATSVMQQSSTTNNSDVLRKLDMYSNKLNFYENKPSSAASLISMVSSNKIFQSQTNLKNVGSPTEPIVCQMFEDYPQPFQANKKPELPRTPTKAAQAKKASKAKTAKCTLVRSKTLKPKSSAGDKNREKSTSKSTKSVKTKENKDDECNKIEIIGVGILENTEAMDQNMIISEIDKLFDVDYEHEEFEDEITEKLNSPDDDEDHVITEKLNPHKLVISQSLLKSDPDLFNKSIISTIALPDEKPRKQSIPPEYEKQVFTNSGENTARLNIDFVKSFEDKVFAIYHKFDNLLTIQATKMADDKYGEIAEKYNELNKQKVQFSTEIERELDGNFNFEEISSNPDLVKRFKELYDLVKNNINSTSESEAVRKNSLTINKRPPLPSNYFKPNNRGKSESLKEAAYTNTGINSQSSLKSNADIREVYAIVNSFGKNLSFNKNAKNSYKNRNNNDELSDDTLTKESPNQSIYKIPPSLSKKIKKMVTPLLNHSKTEEIVDNNNSANDEEKQQFDINLKLKFYKVIEF